MLIIMKTVSNFVPISFMDCFHFLADIFLLYLLNIYYIIFSIKVFATTEILRTKCIIDTKLIFLLFAIENKLRH